MAKVEEMQKMMGRDLIFSHYKLRVDGKNTSHVCIALIRPPKGSNSKEYKAAVAFGAPTDSPNRKIARMIAGGRVLCKRPGRSFKFKCPEGTLQDVFKAALEHATDPHFRVDKRTEPDKVLNVPYAPSWVRTALKNGKHFESQ